MLIPWVHEWQLWGRGWWGMYRLLSRNSPIEFVINYLKVGSCCQQVANLVSMLTYTLHMLPCLHHHRHIEKCNPSTHLILPMPDCCAFSVSKDLGAVHDLDHRSGPGHNVDPEPQWLVAAIHQTCFCLNAPFVRAAVHQFPHVDIFCGILQMERLRTLILCQTSPSQVRNDSKVKISSIQNWEWYWYIMRIIVSRYCVVYSERNHSMKHLAANQGWSLQFTPTLQTKLDQHFLAYEWMRSLSLPPLQSPVVTLGPHSLLSTQGDDIGFPDCAIFETSASSTWGECCTHNSATTISKTNNAVLGTSWT